MASRAQMKIYNEDPDGELRTKIVDRQKQRFREGLLRTKNRKKTYNPKMSAAIYIIKHHIKMGLITRPTECPKCKKSEFKIRATHPHGYENPLNFEWACTDCHGMALRKRNKEERLRAGKKN
jgi:hypothetical protein